MVTAFFNLVGRDLRLALRGDQVYNYAALTAETPNTPGVAPAAAGVGRRY